MDARDDRFDGVAIVRLMSWATAAAVALGLAVLASLSATGSQRIGTAIAALAGGGARPPPPPPRQAEIDSERRSLNEALRLLASDRDRLMTRVDSIERNLDDVTGSIKSQMAARATPENIGAQDPPNLEVLPAITARTPAAKRSDLPDWLANVPEPWPSPSSAMEFAPGPSGPAASVRVGALPEAQPMAPTAVSRTEFGVDIGSGSDLEEVRMLWTAAKARYGRVFGNNLRPIVVRQDRAGFPEYRLVIGPLANASAAARLCATLAAGDTTCSTRPYQGERLIP